jgi:predicted RNase H-like HicB family nuclease
VTFTIGLEREDDDRWLAEVPTLPGVLCYGADRGEAVAMVQVVADPTGLRGTIILRE